MRDERPKYMCVCVRERGVRGVGNMCLDQVCAGMFGGGETCGVLSLVRQSTLNWLVGNR